jgi:hypothetical protein
VEGQPTKDYDDWVLQTDAQFLGVVNSRPDRNDQINENVT